MLAYIIRRILFIVPTLIGIMLLNFALVQFVPGGPVEQLIHQFENESSNLNLLGGNDVDAGLNSNETQNFSQGNTYRGAQGLPEEFIKDLERQFGFDKPPVERFLSMMINYLTFNFGESYFRSIEVIDLVIEKMPVSISLGLWSTLLAYLISIPLGIKKAVDDGSKLDTFSSGIIIICYSLPGFLFAIILLVLFAGGTYYQWFPLRGLTSDNWDDLNFLERTFDYLWHISLPVLASTIGSFATLTLLTKNSFVDEIKKQYVTTAKAKGLSNNQVLYRHVFRNAMLIIIAGFPGLFITAFFGGSLIIETIFSLDGLGRLGFEAALTRDYPVMFGTLYFFGLLGLIIGLISDLVYVMVDPRIDFEGRNS